MFWNICTSVERVYRERMKVYEQQIEPDLPQKKMNDGMPIISLFFPLLVDLIDIGASTDTNSLIIICVSRFHRKVQPFCIATNMWLQLLLVHRVPYINWLISRKSESERRRRGEIDHWLLVCYYLPTYFH